MPLLTRHRTRLAVGAVLAVIVTVAVRLMLSSGGDDEVHAASERSDTTLARSMTTTVATATSVTTRSTTTTTPTLPPSTEAPPPAPPVPTVVAPPADPQVPFPSAPPLGPGDNRVFVIGDSITLGAERELPAALAGWNVVIDAQLSRFMHQAVEVAQARRAEIGRVVVVQIGNNYLGHRDRFAGDLDRLLAVLAGTERVVLVTVAEVSPSRVEVNAELFAAAQRNPSTVVIADWNAMWRLHPDYVQPDGLHLNRRGAAALGALLTNAIGPAPAPAAATPAPPPETAPPAPTAPGAPSAT